MSVLQLLLGADNDLDAGLLPPVQEDGEAGKSVALSDDATTIPLTAAIGAPGYQDGAVFIYQWNGTAYGFHSTVSSPAPAIDFAASVAMNGDGSVLAIGAPDDQSEGRIHMYAWDGTKYAPDEVLDAGGLGPFTGGRTGESVALSKTGTSLLASSPQANPNDQGWAYSWFKSGTWIFVAQRIGETGSAAPGGNFSESMGFSANGLTAVFSQPGGQRLRIFERSVTTTVFSEVFDIVITAGGGPQSVAITDDEGLVFVPGTDGIRSYVNGGGGSWSAAFFEGLPPQSASWDGLVAVARNNDLFVGEGTGNWLHEFSYLNDGDMTFVADTLSPATPQVGWNYAHSLSLVFPIGSRNLAVGEPQRDRLGIDQAGNAYVLVT